MSGGFHIHFLWFCLYFLDKIKYILNRERAFLKFEIKMIDSFVNELKITCVGDGYVGKTCMLWSYVYRKFPKDYVPTVFETHASKNIFFCFFFLNNRVSYLMIIVIN